MVLPRRLCNNCALFYFLLGCGVTLIYFSLTNYSSTPTLWQQRKSGNHFRNFQYAEVCSEWKQALQQAGNQDEIIDQKGTTFNGWNDYCELHSFFTCSDSPKNTYVSQRGNYYVIYNFVQAEKDFGCVESITLSAPGDYRFLDNVIPLADRWQGPISIALYAPGYDFYTTIESIAYLRQCQSDNIKDFVSFHVFFDIDHMPQTRNNTPLINSYQESYNCSLPPPWETKTDEDMYKTQNKLLYPINVARNAAKLASRTFFVFPNDIELYPTRGFIPLFLNFVKENLNLFRSESKNVFVLPIFEVLENQNVPENKTELLEMLNKKTAVVFHQRMCMRCHKVIDSEKWVKTAETKGLSVFATGKRQGRYMVWEPFFICTQKEPLWDERFSWEGQGNKLVQAYTMCVMDYDFHVLDNAFLIHKPGVKKKKVQVQKFSNVVAKSNKLMKVIVQEVQELYGHTTDCSDVYKDKVSK